MSIAGGYFRAVDAAAKLGMDCVQIFTKSSNQWRAKPLTEQDSQRFQDSLTRTGVQMPCGHASYLLNLASPDRDLWKKSVDAFVVELERAQRLGLVGLVVHPGSYRDSTEKAGLSRIVRALKTALRRTSGFDVQVWLENTAGQGTSLGCRFEHLKTLTSEIGDSNRLGVCLDTCHLFASGYRLRTTHQYAQTMDQFDDVVGIKWIRAFHLNDSKREFGSRVDRHEHIGAGHLGVSSFRNVVNDPRFATLPMYMETPKEDDEDQPMDAANLGKLRRLLRRSRASDSPSSKKSRRTPRRKR